jgi:hypothetical protein
VSTERRRAIRTGRQGVVEEVEHGGDVSWFVRCHAPADAALDRAFALQSGAIEHWRTIEARPIDPARADYEAILAVIESAILRARQDQNPADPESADDEALVILRDLRQAGWSITRASS